MIFLAKCSSVVITVGTCDLHTLSETARIVYLSIDLLKKLDDLTLIYFVGKSLVLILCSKYIQSTRDLPTVRLNVYC